MTRSRVAVSVAVVLSALAAAAPAAADPVLLHLPNGAHLTTAAGADLDVPPGYYVDAGTWDVLDLEVHRLQDAETRLTAENESLRKSAAIAMPRWWALASVLVAGVATGIAIEHYR